MTRTAKIITVAAVVIGVALAARMIVPGCARCYAYHKVLSGPNARASLEMQPTQVYLPVSAIGESIRIGYAQVPAPAQTVLSIKYIQGTVVFEMLDGSYAFMRPATESYQSFKQQSIAEYEQVRASSEKDGIPVCGSATSAQTWERWEANPRMAAILKKAFDDPYNWRLEVLRTSPKTWKEVFFCPTDQFVDYIWHALGKVLYCMPAGRIGLFNTGQTKGIIKYTFRNQPGTVMAEVWSPNGAISQEIFVSADEPSMAEERLNRVLASYRFLIDELPDKDRLDQLVLSSLKLYRADGQIE